MEEFFMGYTKKEVVDAIMQLNKRIEELEIQLKKIQDHLNKV